MPPRAELPGGSDAQFPALSLVPSDGGGTAPVAAEDSVAAAARATDDDALPAPDAEIALLLGFVPVTRKQKRKDGWHPPLQVEFIHRLALTGSARDAVLPMEKSISGIEALYKQKGSESFRSAWDAALAIGRRRAALRGARFAGRAPGVRRDWVPAAPAGPSPASLSSAPSPAEGRGEDALSVVCAVCSAAGLAGEAGFGAIPDILAFDPAPARAGDQWDEVAQRAFVIALAATGSASKAARRIGRHAIGAERLRKARGGRGFAEACDAAMDIARDRELAAMGKPGACAGGVDYTGDPTQAAWDEADEEAQAAADKLHAETAESVRMKLRRCRRLYLWEIAPSPVKRAAWEVLCGPVDWERAAQILPQDDEPEAPNFREPGMVMAVRNQWMADVTGGHDKLDELRPPIDAVIRGDEVSVENQSRSRSGAARGAFGAWETGE